MIYFAIGFAFALTFAFQLSVWSMALVYLTTLCSVLLLIIVGSVFILPNKASAYLARQTFCPQRKWIKSYGKPLSLLSGLIIGMSLLYWQAFLSLKLPETGFFNTVLIQAQIVGLPQSQPSNFNQGVKYHYELKLNRLITAPSTSSSSAELIRFDTPASFFRARPKIQLNWYLPAQAKPADFGLQHWPKSGETYWMSVKLKPPVGQFIPGGLDYEQFLFSQGIQAKGYIKASQQISKTLNPLLAANGSVLSANELSQAAPFSIQRVSDAPVISISAWRQSIAQYLEDLWQDNRFAPIYRALLLGDRSQMTPEIWQLLQETGTVHLMAISGLHIGIIAFLGYWLFWLIWKLFVYRLAHRVAYRCLRLNLPLFSSLGALLFASVYAAMSGFSISAERAWLMVLVALLFFVLQRKYQLWQAYFFALFLVLFFASSSILTIGFWLSFVAVALIFVSLPRLREKRRFWQLLYLQLILSLGMLPLMIWTFGIIPSYGLVANLVALPLIAVLVLPALLVGFVLSFLGGETSYIASLIFSLLDWLLGQLWHYLQWLQQLPYAVIQVPKQSGLWAVGVYLGLFALLFLWTEKPRWRNPVLESISMAKAANSANLANIQNSENSETTRFGENLKRSGQTGVLMRLQKQRKGGAVLALLCSVVLGMGLWRSSEPVKHGEFMLTMLDVGQGQAVVIETANHSLLYDSGADWGPTMDGAKLAVLPYLHHQAIRRLDHLMISHSDNDHAGGVRTLLANMTISQATSGQPNILNSRLANPVFTQCVAGQSWRWDGVDFRVLAPQKAWLAKAAKATNGRALSDNDHSCVLKVSAGQHSVLLVGDLSQKAEKWLLEDVNKEMREGAVAKKDEALATDVLVVGHHGSKHSSSEAWLQQLKPTYALISAGRYNRYGFPNSQLIQRLDSQHIQWWNTACAGTVQLQISPKQIKVQNLFRQKSAKWYHQPCLSF